MASVLSILTTLLPIILLIAKTVIENMSAKQKEKDDINKEIDAAITSGDISRINAVIQRLRR